MSLRSCGLLAHHAGQINFTNPTSAVDPPPGLPRVLDGEPQRQSPYCSFQIKGQIYDLRGKSLLTLQFEILSFNLQG
jgi:hypothetical protein